MKWPARSHAHACVRENGHLHFRCGANGNGNENGRFARLRHPFLARLNPHELRECSHGPNENANGHDCLDASARGPNEAADGRHGPSKTWTSEDWASGSETIHARVEDYVNDYGHLRTFHDRRVSARATAKSESGHVH
jgi:hypothetical protein